MKGFKFSKSKGNYLLTIVISSIIFTLIGAYLFIYVPDHEERIIERNFRELNQISHNLQNRAKSLIQNARNVITDKELRDEIKKIVDHTSSRDSSLALHSLQDKLNNHIQKFNGDLSFQEFNLAYDDLGHNDEFENEIEIHINTPKPTEVLYSDRIELPNYQDFLFDCQKSFTSTAQVEECSNSLKNTHLVYKIKIEAPNLIESLLHFDEFESFILTTDQWVIYESHPLGSLVFEKTLDSLKTRSGQIQTTHLKKVKINGTDYDVYVRPIFISLDKQWNLVGLTKSEKVRSKKLSIPLTYSLFLFLISIFVLLLIPLIKLRFINNFEKIDSYNLIFTYSSLVCTTALITSLIFSYTYYQGFNDQVVNKNLECLNTDIKKSFSQELDSVKLFLHNFDSALNKTEPANLQDEGSNYNPFQRPLVTSQHKPFLDKYPFVEDYFQINSDGFQELKWTVKKNRTPKFDVSKRDYVTKISNGTGYALSENNPDSIQFYLQSIVSYNTGEQISIVSRTPSIPTIDRDVIGLTTKLYTFFDTLLPLGYQFSVVDEEGLVQFHLDSDKNLNENFYDELSNDLPIRNRINTKNFGVEELEYHGVRSRMFIDQLHPDVNLFLIVIYNKEITHGVFSRVIRTTLAISLTAIILLFIVTLVLARVLTKPISYNALLRPYNFRQIFVLWSSIITICGCVIPLFFLTATYNYELKILGSLSNNTVLEEFEEKQNSIDLYIYGLSKELGENQKIALDTIHQKRKDLGNFLVPAFSGFEYSGNLFEQILSARIFQLSGFDYLMDNISDKIQANHSIASNWNTSVQNSISKKEAVNPLENLQILFVSLCYLLLIAIILFVLYSALNRFFSFELESKTNWRFRKNSLSNTKVFLVSLKNQVLEDEETLSALTITKVVSWQEYKSELENIFTNKVGHTLVKGFPDSLDLLSVEDITAFCLLSRMNANILLTSKQNPILILKEIESKKDFLTNDQYEDFVDSISKYATYYDPIQKDEIIRNPKNNALRTNSSYKKLMNTLSREEKYLIYDLADDGVINIKNRLIINALIKKGVISFSKTLDFKKHGIIRDAQFFDENYEASPILKKRTTNPYSFRSFVMDNIDVELVKDFSENVEYKSTWAKIRVPLLIVFIGIFAFVMITQKEYFNQFLGILTSLGAVIGILTRFSSILSFGKSTTGGGSETTP